MIAVDIVQNWEGKKKDMPIFLFGFATGVPPCASAMEGPIQSPRPMPQDLVV
jgi:hypothetical protein